jgi:hypothetical protein
VGLSFDLVDRLGDQLFQMHFDVCHDTSKLRNKLKLEGVKHISRYSVGTVGHG